MKNSDRKYPTLGKVDETSTELAPGRVLAFEAPAERINTPEKYTEIDDLVKRWSSDPEKAKGLKEARQWIAVTFHEGEGVTVRTLRLRKGLSQVELAREICTSQSHIARIERGNDNLTIDTCRRLAGALGVDLNIIDLALRRQEKNNNEK
ncbi:MAG: helix-turn-helix transcriptional regulator [Gammaproteobacteria bacterium]|nr:helix-turn-helix transcriptional regulator [Gammaproteobacteria bacterium]